MVDMSEVHAFAERVAAEFRPERIILFGSYARGTATADSDVDLLIVLPFEGKSWRTASEIRRRARPTFPTDLIVRTPEQMRRRMARGDHFLREVFREGRTLYEA
jgi:predicted nucleotidyltransferase